MSEVTKTTYKCDVCGKVLERESGMNPVLMVDVNKHVGFSVTIQPYGGSTSVQHICKYCVHKNLRVYLEGKV